MSEESGGAIERKFTRLSTKVARATGRPRAFALCVASVVIWAVTRPLMGFSEAWQLIINTGTTIERARPEAAKPVNKASAKR